MITDCHSHTPQANAIISREPHQSAVCNMLYSVGIHPWNTNKFNSSALNDAAQMESTVAIGETGLDMLRGPSFDVQRERFIYHIQLSEQLKKPLIIHCVRAFSQLLEIKKAMQPTQSWIIHGFNRKPELAKQLLQADCYISLGTHFNSHTAQIIPPERLLLETDDCSTSTIEDVATAIAITRQSTTDEILNLSAQNIVKVFKLNE